MPVELTAMKNTPSKRASLLIAAWYCCSSSSPDSPDTPCGLAIFVLTHSTMPVRGDYYWRKSDSHPPGYAANPDRRCQRDILADSNPNKHFFRTKPVLVTTSPHPSRPHS